MTAKAVGSVRWSAPDFVDFLLPCFFVVIIFFCRCPLRCRFCTAIVSCVPLVTALLLAVILLRANKITFAVSISVAVPVPFFTRVVIGTTAMVIPLTPLVSVSFSQLQVASKKSEDDCCSFPHVGCCLSTDVLS